MGRKIPGKKHRGIKDPEKQQLIRYKSIENKINSAPKNPDEQGVSKTLQQFIKLKENFKKNPKRKRKRNSKSSLITTDPILRKKEKLYKTKNSAPAFNQKFGESTGDFLFRVNQTVKEVLKESKFEDKFRVKVQRNLKTGEVSNVIKQKEDPLKSFLKEAKDKENTKGKKKKQVKEPKLSKSQKKKQKLDEKKAKKEVEVFDGFTDKVEFGDIVHAPPTLTAPKRVNKTNCAPRPGTKDLLLKSILEPNKQEATFKKKTIFERIQGSGKVNKKGKRKDLPQAIRRQLETQRNEIVKAYRSIKAKKILNRS